MVKKIKRTLDKKRFLIGLLWLVLIIVILKLLISIAFGLVEMYQLKKEFKTKNAHYQEFLKEQKSLTKKLNGLNKNINIEKVARDELNMKKNGEVIYKLVSDKDIEEYSSGSSSSGGSN
ncbi:MAG: septum formation initiator family protein [Fusobacteria bacterium]|nr:septum formation initiator family protein [Fusobacteriota bacterium]